MSPWSNSPGNGEGKRWQTVSNSSPVDTDKTMLCKLYNKGTCRYDKQSGHVVTSQHYCSNCYAVTGRRFEHPKSLCIRLKPKFGSMFSIINIAGSLNQGSFVRDLVNQMIIPTIVK